MNVLKKLLPFLIMIAVAVALYFFLEWGGAFYLLKRISSTEVHTTEADPFQ